MTWPKYRSLSPHAISFSHLEYFASDTQSLKTIVTILLLIAIYFLGIRLSLPFADVQRVQHSVAQSAFLSAISLLFTGGALGNLGLFALGVIPLIFLYGGSATVIGSRLRVQAEVTLRSLSLVAILAALTAVWLTSIDAIPKTILGFVAITSYLALGTLILFWIENKIAKHGGPDIISLNALLLGANYIRTLFLAQQVTDLAAVLLIALFILSFALLVRKVDVVQVLNIREEEVREGLLPIPATNSLLRLFFLILILIILAGVTTLINFFLTLNLSPLGDSLPEVALVVLAQIAVILLLMRNQFIDDFLGQFDSIMTAKRLMVNNWVISGIEIGQPTAEFLRKRVVQAHRANYFFYLIWILLFSAVEWVSRLVKMPITPLPFGPLGFVIVLTLCSEVGYGLVVAFLKYVERINFREFWTTPRPAALSFELEVESYNLDELLDRILSTLKPDEREKLRQSFTSGKATLKDLIPVIIAAIRYREQHLVETRIDRMLYKFALCTVLTLAILVLVIWVIQIAFGPILDPTFKAGLLLFAVPLELTFIFEFGLHQDIKALVGRLAQRNR